MEKGKGQDCQSLAIAYASLSLDNPPVYHGRLSLCCNAISQENARQEHNVENASMRQYYAFCFALGRRDKKDQAVRPPVSSPCSFQFRDHAIGVIFSFFKMLCATQGNGCGFSATQSMFLSSSYNMLLCPRSNVRMPQGCSTSNIGIPKPCLQADGAVW